ncbi:hypothetical protein BB14905_07174 [Bacillus sp. B14905]|nr:hypothetical protein BB14905_07174 [Bacillus sp. B14905]
MINNTQQWVLFFYLSAIYQSAVKKWRAGFLCFLIKKLIKKIFLLFFLRLSLTIRNVK